MNTVKAFAVNCSILLLTFFVMFGLAELITRMVYKDETVMYPRYTTGVQYNGYHIRRLRPNSEFTHTSIDGYWSFRTNSQGFRNDVDFSENKNEGIIRVASLGDSHTEGYEVHQENTFSHIVESYLNHHGLKSEVMNTGVSGFSTAEELILLREGLQAFQPDVIILGFYANDYSDNVKSGLYGLDTTGRLKELKKTHLPGVSIQDFVYRIPGVGWLGEHSYFYSMLFNRVWVYFKMQLAKENKVELAVSVDRITPQEEQLTNALLSQLCDTVHQMNSRLIVLDIPMLIGESDHSSMLASTKQVVDSCADTVLGENVLRDYKNLSLLHVAHGHRHISELSHALLGVAAAKDIKQSIQP
jgi:hypothetical protein